MRVHSQKMENNQKGNRLKITSYHLAKRILDFVLGSLALVFFLPLLLGVSYSIKKENRQAPIFFKQKRMGLKGKEFKIYKFRTMRQNAERVLEENPVLYQEFKANGYKFEDGKDPRITQIGHFLRRTSLDELPQFLNVVNGSMSLVGPRPVVAKELEEYGTHKELFLSVKPGITGLWQVSGRSTIGYPERCALELKYAEQASFVFDLVILAKTVRSVLKKEGAY